MSGEIASHHHNKEEPMPPLRAVNDEPVIQEFEGKPVKGIKLIVTRTGDGLSDSMEVDPVHLEIGDRTGVLILAETVKIRYEKHKYEKGEEDMDGLDRVQIIEAQGAILLPADSPELAAVRKMIATIRGREKAKRDAKRGQLTTDDLGDGNKE